LILNFKSFLFLFISSSCYAQAQIDSIFIYSSSIDYYMGVDPFSYSVARFPKEENPLVLKNRDTLSMLDLALSKLISKDSTKSFSVYFLAEVYTETGKEILAFTDKKRITYKGITYKRNKWLYDFFIRLIEIQYNDPKRKE
jgi:hypothetical protein